LLPIAQSAPPHFTIGAVHVPLLLQSAKSELATLQAVRAALGVVAQSAAALQIPGDLQRLLEMSVA